MELNPSCVRTSTVALSKSVGSLVAVSSFSSAGIVHIA